MILDGVEIENLVLGQNVNVVIDYGRELENNMIMILDSCALITPTTKFFFIQNGSVVEDSSSSQIEFNIYYSMLS